jgi:hypothetical protein
VPVCRLKLGAEVGITNLYMKDEGIIPSGIFGKMVWLPITH